MQTLTSEPERWVLDSDTSAENTHNHEHQYHMHFLTRYKYLNMYASFLWHILWRLLPRYVYLGIGVIMGNVTVADPRGGGGGSGGQDPPEIPGKKFLHIE